MTAPTGFVGWPEEEARRFRESGWWTSELIGDALWSSAAAHADRVALISGGVSVTYGEMTSAADALANRLIDLGVAGRDEPDIALVQLPNGFDFVLLTLACLRAGIVPVMVLPALRAYEVGRLAAQTRARAYAVPDVFRGFDLQALAAKTAAAHSALDLVLVAGAVHPGHHDLRAMARADGAAREVHPARHIEPEDPAILLLSGGTTGVPKLIARTHNDYLYNMRRCAEVSRLSRDSVYLAALPAEHNFALGCPGILGTLLIGGRVVLLPSPEPAAVFEVIALHRVTHTATVPAVLLRWLEFVAGRAEQTDTSSLQVIAVGGARLAPEIAERVCPTLGASVQQAFGMAEGLCNFTRLDDPVATIVNSQGRPISPGDEIRVVDPSGEDVPVGVTGELLARGPYTIRGYFRAEEHNRGSFTPDGWYRTGDLVTRDGAGNLTVAGRLKEQINRAGEKIAIEEVEDLVRRVEGVRHAAVFAVADATLGETVAVAVVAGSGEVPTLPAIREALTSFGAARFKLPDRLLLVDEMPVTPVGKVDRAALRRACEGLALCGEKTNPQTVSVPR